MATEYSIVGEGPLLGYTHVLLYRHGRVTSEPRLAEADRTLAESGLAGVQQVARRLAEEVTTGRREFEITMVLRGTYRQVEETAVLVRQALDAQEPGAWPTDVRPTPALNPVAFWSQPGAPKLDGIHNREGRDPITTGRALLIIGHEPQLSDISRGLLPRGASVVTPSAGVSCIKLGGPGRWRRASLQWVIEPEDEKTTELLRAKIASKMEVAKVFGAVITFALGIILNGLLNSEQSAAMPHPQWVTAAAGVLALALVLYVAVLYGYDSLLMPSRFWGTSTTTRKSRRVVARPPSSQSLVMQQNMVWLWSRPFTLANVLVITAFGLLAWGGIGVSLGWVLATAVLAAVAAYWARRIDLGVQD